jgi:hypothetical protein
MTTEFDNVEMAKAIMPTTLPMMQVVRQPHLLVIIETIGPVYIINATQHNSIINSFNSI